MTIDLQHVHAQLLPLASESAHADAARDWIGRWLEGEDFVAWRPLLLGLIEGGHWDTLLDSFYRVLPFGTGGRRGPVGLGPNRMNPWSLGTSVIGNIRFLRERFGDDAPLSVVVAADVRVFRDLRGTFPAGVANPLLGLSSVELGKQAAALYAAEGLDVHMLDPERGGFLSTPELSFLIRRLGASGGLNVSASHNHPDDNGGKFYTEQGAQEVPPHDARMVEHVVAVDSLRAASWDDALASGRIHFLDEGLHDEYLAESSSVLAGTERGARVVFSNLHGVGDTNAGEALERAGFEVHYVASQREHHGAFPNVRFRAPNPEYPTAYAEAVVLADEVDADLILTTDPDADRIGAMVPTGDRWRFLTGNELSSLVAAARFRGVAPGKIGIKTEVTSQLFSRVVAAAGGQVVDHLLVGCKYIAMVMRELETTGRFGDITGSVGDVLIGTEESHGFLLTPNIRDKDAAAPALVLAELCADRKAAGSSMLEALLDLYREHGAIANVQVPLVMAGAIGRQRILKLQAGLRSAPPSQIAGRSVTAFFDRQDEAGVFGPIVSVTDAAARDVLSFQLGPDARLVIRPSGTEPKTKIYAEAVVPVDGDVDAALAAAKEQAEDLALDFIAQALRHIGLEVPSPGLRCSPLLGIDERIAFGAQVWPEALRRAQSGATGAELRAWLDETIGGWGGDGRGMTSPAWAWVRDQSSDLAPDVVAAFDEAWAV